MSDNVLRNLIEVAELRHENLMAAIETGFSRVDAALDRNANQASMVSRLLERLVA